MSDKHDLQIPGHPTDDVAAYALGALEPAEADAFVRHLRTCPDCRHELVSFERVVGELPMAAPKFTAPPKLRRDVLRAVANEPRAAEPTAATARRPSRSRSWPWTWSRPMLAVGTALAAVVVALVVVFSTTGGPGTRVVDAQVVGPGSASVHVTGNSAQLVVHHFPQAPAGKIYEVWLVRGNRPPAPTRALFHVRADGSQEVDVPGSVQGVRQLLVTPERAPRGSAMPTHAPVIAATLA